jgi:hypothetical protein
LGVSSKEERREKEREWELGTGIGTGDVAGEIWAVAVCNCLSVDDG